MRETVEIMRYPVTLTPAPEGGYMVSFVDINKVNISVYLRV